MKIYVAHPMDLNVRKLLVDSEIMDHNDHFSFTHKKGRIDVHFFFPEDWSPNVESSEKIDINTFSKSIFKTNCILMDNADVILACIDDRDPGVMFEIGYGCASNKIIVTFSDKGYGSNIMISCSSTLHCSSIIDLKNSISVIYSLCSLK